MTQFATMTHHRSIGFETMTPDADFFAEYLQGFTQVIATLDQPAIAAVAQRVILAYAEGRQLFVTGNGGSAATASHMAADFGKTMLGKNFAPSLRTLPRDVIK